MEIWFIAIIVFLALDLILILWVVWRRRKARKFTAEEANYIRSHWIRIIDAFQMHPKQAILDADKILDYALMRKGFGGNLGEKLKKVGARFSNLDGVWRAHKLRNKVAHELGEVPMEEAKMALRQFKQALNDLGANL